MKATRLIKASAVRGRSLVFRNATPDDDAFILRLRTDEKKGRFLSATQADIAMQRNWLEGYRLSNDQCYFIIEHAGHQVGTVRLYDARGISFCWGSWILVEEAPHQAGIESALMVYAYAVDHLGFRESHFDVRKQNESVWRFHERFGAERCGDTEMDYLYTISESRIAQARMRFRRFLPADVTVDEFLN